MTTRGKEPTKGDAAIRVGEIKREEKKGESSMKVTLAKVTKQLSVKKVHPDNMLN